MENQMDKKFVIQALADLYWDSHRLSVVIKWYEDHLSYEEIVEAKRKSHVENDEQESEVCSEEG